MRKSVYIVTIRGANTGRCYEKDFGSRSEAEEFIAKEKKAERHKGLLTYTIDELIVDDGVE